MITFHEVLSEKKINTVSLNPVDQTTLAVGGLERVVKLFDVRKFNSYSNISKKGGSKSVKSFAEQETEKSINSTFFSPSGKYLLSTCMSNELLITTDPHLQSGTIKKSGSNSSIQSIRHNTQTGMYLSTFMGRWHPTQDVFVVGSLAKPREIDIFGFDGKGKTFGKAANVSGDYLTAVCSRCCFHPTENVIAGGNSSGRVTVIR